MKERDRWWYFQIFNYLLSSNILLFYTFITDNESDFFFNFDLGSAMNIN